MRRASTTCLKVWGRNGLGLVTLTLGMAAVAGSGMAQAEKPRTLEKELLQQAPRIIQYLQEHKYKNVGVLKFRVRKGDEPISDNVGPLNMSLARRLEIALVMANDEEGEPRGIIRDASAVAARTPGASHLNPAGRAKLFQPQYPLAWGKEQVTADAFLTGIAEISSRRDQMTVHLLIFANDGELKLKKVVPSFTVAMDIPNLNEAGESFNLRGLFGKKNKRPSQEEKVAAAQETAAKVKDKETPHPAKDQNAPVQLVILYNEEKVPIETADGKARVREPREGEKVALIIKKDKNDPENYAVVVKVNGVNTALKQQKSAELCRKWILNTENPETRIDGFNISETDQEVFRIASPEESKKNEVNYGENVGTISMVVFGAQKKGTPKDLPAKELPGSEKEADDLAAITNSALPKENPESLRALKETLAEVGKKTRGTIEPGVVAPSNQRRVEFDFDPVPVMTMTISYYKPQGSR